MLPKTMRFMLFRQQWRLHFVSRRAMYDRKNKEQLDGVCAVPAHPGHVLTKEQRTVHARDDLDDEDLMETIVHEMGHAAFPDRSEEYIDQFARDVTRLLGRLGYKRGDHGCS